MSKPTSTSEIRSAFLEYYKDKGHQIVPSGPLVPGNDPTLMFTNAGMVPFKDVFLGRDQRSYTRATSSQRCVRAGGKHNDLENVGYTARHHTFFEMLGNFSFGDYFKREAIQWAWEFLTEVLGLPEEKLWVTVYDQDPGAEDIWLKEMGVSAERFSRIGAKDNFWSMGDTGPCGPCSEIFYDHGADVQGGPPGSPEEDGDRYIEIWNIVFMEFDRAADGTLNSLPKPSIDTGMGLERLAAVMQNVHANYEIDLFVNLLKAVQKATNTSGEVVGSHKVIADHIRACAFMIVDGVLPSNEGRGYVLRRIIRRAIRHGYKLGQTQPFFSELTPALVAEMGEAYPELAKAEAHVIKMLLQEEKRFAETLEQGMKLLDDAIANIDGGVIPGDVVFKLYDTYGFPADLTNDVARERDLTIDEDGFEVAMERQRQKSRDGSSFESTYDKTETLAHGSQFTGYTELSDQGKVVAILKDGEAVTSLSASESGAIVLDSTSFYAESGGQVGDSGQLISDGVVINVVDTQKQRAEQGAIAHVHIVSVDTGSVAVGDVLQSKVDTERRTAVELNHSATHLMHAALRNVLGDHVAQKGSLVDPDKLRFDFSHYEPVTTAQVVEIEQQVNAQIRANVATDTKLCSFDEALESGAMALFGEKYGDEVRVLSIGGNYSVELCGGTHVERAGDVGLFKITAETGVASGVRRIEAITGQTAFDYIAATEATLSDLAAQFKAGRDDVAEKVQQLITKNRDLEKELDRLKSKIASAQSGDLASQAVEVGGVKVLAALLDGVDAKTLRDSVDQLKDKLGKAVIVLASVNDGKVSLVAGVTKAEAGPLHAGKIVGAVAQQVGGKGGGRPDMAQAGGTEPEKLAEALASVQSMVAVAQSKLG
ncbi:MAG: alanyl-tRNA synthetase [Gammaproteobacteria bacterium]|jgi:alanyl-tRNA synthetase